MKSLYLFTLIIFFLSIQLCNQTFSMDITPEEWAQIQKLEAEGKILFEHEQQELQEAIKRSEQEERERQAREQEKAERERQEAERGRVAAQVEYKLSALTDDQMAGGVVGSIHYKPGLDFAKLHKEGNIVAKEFLTNFFEKSLF